MKVFFGKEKDDPMWMRNCTTSAITRVVFPNTTMVIVSKYTFVEKEPDSGVFR
jgi:hypothetical protein